MSIEEHAIETREIDIFAKLKATDVTQVERIIGRAFLHHIGELNLSEQVANAIMELITVDGSGPPRIRPHEHLVELYAGAPLDFIKLVAACSITAAFQDDIVKSVSGAGNG